MFKPESSSGGHPVPVLEFSSTPPATDAGSFFDPHPFDQSITPGLIDSPELPPFIYSEGLSIPIPDIGETACGSGLIKNPYAPTDTRTEVAPLVKLEGGIEVRGPHELMAAHRQYFKETYNRQREIERQAHRYTGETSQQLEIEVNQVHTTLEAWAKDLGFDITNRITPMEHIHFMRSPQEFDRVTGHGEKIGGVQNDEGVFINEDPSPITRTQTSTHELVHDMSFRCRSITVQTVESDQVGYQITTANGSAQFKAVNEMVTELATLHALQEYGSIAGLPRSITHSGHVGYPEYVIIGHELIQQAAEYSGIRPAEIFKKLEAGLLTGSDEGLKLLMRPLYQEQHARPGRLRLASFISAIDQEGLSAAFSLRDDEVRWARAMKRINQSDLRAEIKKIKPWEDV